MRTAERGTWCLAAGIVVAVAGLCPPATLAQAAGAGAGAAPPRFGDPARREKLLAAVPEIDRLFRDYATGAHVPGIAWALLVDGEPVQFGAAGHRELATQAPVTEDTVFRIASMTKSFTALAILALRDEGRLSLDDPAERYVPELAGLSYPTADSPRLTIRQLLSHAGGFPEDNPWGDRQLALDDDEMSALMRQGIPFSNPPGTAYEYSNYGFAILGRIVSRVSGMPYAEYVEARILRPLGMTSTTMSPAAVAPDRLAHGYRWEDEQWKDEPPLPDGAFGPMGGMLTSMRDLARYVGMMMSAWPPRDEPDRGPVRRSTLREMQQVARARPAAVTRAPGDGLVQLTAAGYGFGLRVTQTCALSQIVGHAGGLPGYGSLMLWLPEHGVGLIAAGNLTYTSWGPRFDAAFEALRRTGALEPRAPQPSAALVAARDDVSRLVRDWDDELADRVAAENLFQDRSKDRRRRELEELRARHGACRPDGPFEVENALRGQWAMSCERGALRAAITLAPTVPPRVQFLSVVSADPARDARPRGACP
jgi:CubicO group peptidase (beta-lactamase class C family)